MPDLSEKELVSELARDAVSKTAPQELPLFRALSDSYFKDPAKALKEQAGKDEMLGFGAGEAVTLLTPVALAVAIEVVQFVAQEVERSVKAESRGLIDDLVKRMFRKFRPAKEERMAPSLTTEQLVEVRQLAFAKARQLSIPEEQAGLLADSLVGDLVVPRS